MKALRWLGRHWYLPLMAVALGLGWLWLRGRGASPLGALKRELEAIDAAHLAKQDAAERGHLKARNAVKKRYADQLADLDATQLKKARVLQTDPAALAKYLVKVGGRAR